MNIDLIKLNSGLVDEIVIDDVVSFDNTYLSETDIIKLDNVKLTGSITKNSIDEYSLFLDIEGVMVLPCAITLKPVDYPFKINVDGNLMTILEEIDKNIKKGQNTIDILPIIWENILMEIPMRVVSDDISSYVTEGNGWRLITDEKEPEDINPELSKLKDLL